MTTFKKALGPNTSVDDAIGNTNGAWDDIQGKVTLGDAVANPTYEAYRNTSWKTWFLRHDQADEIHLALQLPHMWNPTTDVKFHVHYIPMVNPTSAKTFALAGTYSWAVYGEATPANSGWTPWTATDTIATTDAFKEKIISCFTATPPSTAKESAILLIYLKRDTTPDTYDTDKTEGTTGAANIAILSLDAHFEKNKDGTNEEFPS